MDISHTTPRENKVVSDQPIKVYEGTSTHLLISTLVGGGRSRWSSCLRLGSAVARLLGLRVRIPPGAWCLSLVSVVCSSGRGLCDVLITRPEESYRLWCVIECDLETSRMRRPWPALGCCLDRDWGERSTLHPDGFDPPGKSSPHPLEAGWFPEPVWAFLKRNIFRPCQESNTGFSSPWH
jgi:hypothetical protein